MDKIKWETVTYTIAELKPAGGVVTQRDILEKYKAEHSDDEVKTFSGFKYDYQNKTVSLRIAIADPTIAADSGTVAKIEPELLQSERNELVALKEKYDELKNQLRCSNDVFLGSENNYIELKMEYDTLKAAVADDSQDFNLATKLTETQKICHELQNERDELGAKLETADETYEGLRVAHTELLKKYDALEKEKETLHEGYDNVVAGARKDDTEFYELKKNYDNTVAWNSTLKGENDRLKNENKELTSECNDLLESMCKLTGENDRLILRLAEIDEDSADLVEAKKAIVEDGGISLDEVESTLIPTSDELADAAVKVAESEATGKSLLAPKEEITVDEAKERYGFEVEDAVENQEPVTVDAQVNGVEIKVADTMDTPEGELDDDTPDCRSDGTVPEDNENE